MMSHFHYYSTAIRSSQLQSFFFFFTSCDIPHNVELLREQYQR